MVCGVVLVIIIYRERVGWKIRGWKDFAWKVTGWGGGIGKRGPWADLDRRMRGMVKLVGEKIGGGCGKWGKRVGRDQKI